MPDGHESLRDHASALGYSVICVIGTRDDQIVKIF